MCLAVPARVIEIDGSRARVEMGGNVREADLTLMSGVELGEYLLVHAGFAIGRIDSEAARETLRDLEEIAQCVGRVSDILEKLHRVTEIVTKPYLGETEIMDLERSVDPDTRGRHR